MTRTVPSNEHVVWYLFTYRCGGPPLPCYETPALPGRYLVHTFGCQMNAHDSDRMEEVLRATGWTRADGVEDADLVVLNTCSVREKAEQKLRSEVGKLAPFKAKNPGVVLAVAGCVAQQEGEKLLQRVAHQKGRLSPWGLVRPLWPAPAFRRSSAVPGLAPRIGVGLPMLLVLQAPGIAQLRRRARHHRRAHAPADRDSTAPSGDQGADTGATFLSFLHRSR